MPLNSRAGWLLFLAALSAWPALLGAEPDPLLVELQAAGLEPTRQGMEKFLEPQRLTPARVAHVRALLADLGDDNFQTREKATAALIAMPHLPRTLLENPDEKDPERSRRIAEILDEGRRSQAEHKLYLALRTIGAKQIKGLAPLLLDLMPQFEQDHVQRAAAVAVAAAAERSDAKVLRDVLASKRSSQARVAAVTALAAVLGKEAARELEGYCEDKESRVVLAAAVALLNQENRKPLATLTRLLEAEQADVRLAAVIILREVSGKQIDYASEDEPKQRAKGAAAWREWVAQEGQTATLHLPVGVRKGWRGRIVVAGDSHIREIDAITGKTLFEVGGYRYPWGRHGAPEGHRLVVDYSESFVEEYDAQGKECWKQKVPGQPTGVQRLANGRTLLALSGANKVVEIDRAGKVVWEVPLAGRPTTAQRLADGNTLVSSEFAGKIVAVNRQGDVVWQIAGLGQPHTAEQLDNGNVLVCEFNGGVINEYNRAGKVVWSKRGVNNPAQAQRLPNGNTLVSGADGLMEFDPKGNQVRHFRLGRSRFFAD